LIWVSPDGALQSVLDPLRIDEHIAGDADGLIEPQDKLALARTPNSISGNDGRSGAGRQFCEGRADACFASEEVDEDPFVQADVLIDQNSDGAIILECLKNTASGLFLAEDHIAAPSASRFDKRVEQRIIQRPNNDIHWLGHQSVTERAEFPGSQMKSREKHPFAGRLSFAEVFETFVSNPLVDIRSVHAAHPREDNQLAGDRTPDTIHDAGRKAGQFDISGANSRQLRYSQPQALRVAPSQRVADCPWSEGERAQRDAREYVLDPITYRTARRHCA